MSKTVHSPALSSLPGQDDQGARLAASVQVDQVENTFSDQQLCDWYEAQPETYLNHLYENFGANTPRQAWVAHMDGKRTIRCACCDSSNLEQFCHLAPDPVFGCRNCGTQLNVDGSVCAGRVDQAQEPTLYWYRNEYKTSQGEWRVSGFCMVPYRWPLTGFDAVEWRSVLCIGFDMGPCV